MRDTIVGVATAAGDGGIAIVRLSGGQAEALSEETAARLQGLQHELEARLGKDGEDNA